MGDLEPSTPKPELAAVSHDFDTVVEELATGIPLTPQDREKYLLVSRFDIAEDPIDIPSRPGKFDHILIGVGQPTLEGGESHTIALSRSISGARSENVTYIFRNDARNPLQIIDESGATRTNWEDVADSKFGQRALLNIYRAITDQVEERKNSGLLRAPKG